MTTSNYQSTRLHNPECWYKFAYLMTNSADPDQLASSELHCLQRQGISGLITMPHPPLIISQSDYLIQIVDINSQTEWQTVQIQIRSQLIWIYTVWKGWAHPSSAGPGLIVEVNGWCPSQWVMLMNGQLILELNSASNYSESLPEAAECSECSGELRISSSSGNWKTRKLF